MTRVFVSTWYQVASSDFLCGLLLDCVLNYCCKMKVLLVDYLYLYVLYDHACQNAPLSSLWLPSRLETVEFRHHG